VGRDFIRSRNVVASTGYVRYCQFRSASMADAPVLILIDVSREINGRMYYYVGAAREACDGL
jgi:hypothetical protein